VTRVHDVPRRIVAISGSLQARSTNTALVQLARTLAPEETHVEISEPLDTLPYFNPEIDVEPAPVCVQRLREQIASADGVLIASPEYAHEMPGVLKNALDWLVSSGELYGKCVAVLCAAPSAGRGSYARQALAQTLAAQGARLVLSETVAVTAAERGGEPSASVVEAVQSAIEVLARASGRKATGADR
jgi:NAD(P)H-dependent FMN reductase